MNAGHTPQTDEGAAAAGHGCELCREPGGRVVFEHPELRVIHAREPGLEAFYRVIWQAHVREFSQLDAASQLRCMRAVAAVERAMLEVIAPDKVNIASLGNMVAHLHWHVIARYRWDAFFPAPVWAAPQPASPQREQAAGAGLQTLLARRAALETCMQRELAAALA